MDALQRHKAAIALRESLKPLGHTITIRQATDLLQLVGNTDVIMDAMLNLNRPQWLTERVGANPHTPTHGVLLHNEDRAGFQEFGHADCGGWPT